MNRNLPEAFVIRPIDRVQRVPGTERRTYRKASAKVFPKWSRKIVSRQARHYTIRERKLVRGNVERKA